MAPVHQEAHFVGYFLWDLEPVKIFHCWRDIIIFPNIADDSTAHILYALKLVNLVLRKASQEGVAVVYA